MSELLADDTIAAHVSGCGCPRCAGLEVCPSCGQQKLDADWCFSCCRLVFLFTAREWAEFRALERQQSAGSTP